jgi:YHS domain-containing protein
MKRAGFPANFLLSFFGKDINMDKGKQGTSKDPVCGMTVNENGAEQLQHKGKDYFFCTDDCKQAFKANPEKYAQGQKGTQKK